MDNNDSFNNFNQFKKLSFGENFEPPKVEETQEAAEILFEIASQKESGAEEEPAIQPKEQNITSKTQPSKNKKTNNQEGRDFTIRVIVYSLVFIILLFMIFNQAIINAYFLNKANDAYAKGDYLSAFKSFKSAFSTNIDNSKYAAKYFSTMDKIEFYPIVQKEMIKLKKEYNNPKVNNAIENLFAKHRKKILDEAGSTYIDNTPTNSNIIHWSPLVSVSVKINGHGVPEYYVSQIQDAFRDWSRVLDNELTFEFNDNKNPNIEIVFVDSISGATEQYGQKIEILGSTEPFYTGRNLIKTRIRFKKTDIDGSALTENQIYNLALHEIGHAIGISGHSYNRNDVMYPTNNDAVWSSDSATLFISKKTFTSDDKNTIKLFYKIIPDITNLHRFNEYNTELYYPEIVLGSSDKIAQKKLQESQTYMNMISGNYISYMELGEGYFSTKNYTEAKNAFLSAVKLAKDSMEFYNAYYNLAVNAYEAEDYQSAIEYATVANTYIDDKRANEVIGFSYIKLKKTDEAQKQFEELVKENPDNILFSYTLTDIYFSKFNLFKALGEMKRIKKINPGALSDDIYKNYRIFGIIL